MCRKSGKREEQAVQMVSRRGGEGRCVEPSPVTVTGLRVCGVGEMLRNWGERGEKRGEHEGRGTLAVGTQAQTPPRGTGAPGCSGGK